MDRLLDGRRAVITGGSSGIGLATTRLFAAEGARVVITGRRQDALDVAVASIGSAAIGIRADAASEPDLRALFETVRAERGGIDVLVANASIAEGAALGELTEEHIDRQLAINVKGMALTAQYALPLLTPGASVILMSSIVVQTGSRGRSIYAATKAAERSFARSWLTELADRRIRVNALLPGPTATPGLANLIGADDPDAAFATIGARSPRGTIIEPEEVAKAALFLASDLSSGVNGIELPVDGGVAQAYSG